MCIRDRDDLVQILIGRLDDKRIVVVRHGSVFGRIRALRHRDDTVVVLGVEDSFGRSVDVAHVRPVKRHHAVGKAFAAFAGAGVPTRSVAVIQVEQELQRLDTGFGIDRHLPFAVDFADNLNAIGTVSYTHLDVYKRQAQRPICLLGRSGSSEKPRAPNRKTGAHARGISPRLCQNQGAAAVRTVSYTHLDVYKRQSPT